MSYRMWWSSGMGAQIFEDGQVEALARKFDFDPEELREKGEVKFIDDGEVVGGVTKA